MRLIQRELFSKIKPWIERPEIIVIMGSRQVGKTTLLKMIMETLPEKQKLYLDLEDQVILEICNSGIETFIQYLQLNGYNPSKKFFVLIDEIQYLENPSNFLKLLYDHYPDLKLIVTGSSSFQIKQKFKDSLTGRKIVFELDSFSFNEFLQLKSPKLLEKRIYLGDIFTILNSGYNKSWSLVLNEFLPIFWDYLTFGGYPKPAQETRKEIKIALINEIFTSYVRKDIKDIGNIVNVTGYNQLVKLLAHQIGNQVNFNELSNTLQLHQNTLKKFVFLLENTFIISLLRPYFQNKRKELSKMPKVYFLDIGLRNAIANNFQWPLNRSDLGSLVENFVFLELKRKFTQEQLFYWRTLSKAEIDFVLQLDNLQIVPIEVKAARLNKPVISRAFHSFIQKYKPKSGIIINLNFVGVVEVNGCSVYFLPPMAI